MNELICTGYYRNPLTLFKFRESWETVSQDRTVRTVVTVSQDGTVVTVSQDGTDVTVSRDRTDVTVSQDGTVVTVSQDGTVVTVSRDGTDGDSVTRWD